MPTWPAANAPTATEVTNCYKTEAWKNIFLAAALYEFARPVQLQDETELFQECCIVNSCFRWAPENNLGGNRHIFGDVEASPVLQYIVTWQHRRCARRVFILWGELPWKATTSRWPCVLKQPHCRSQKPWSKKYWTGCMRHMMKRKWWNTELDI